VTTVGDSRVQTSVRDSGVGPREKTFGTDIRALAKNRVPIRCTNNSKNQCSNIVFEQRVPGVPGRGTYFTKKTKNVFMTKIRYEFKLAPSI